MTSQGCDRYESSVPLERGTVWELEDSVGPLTLGGDNPKPGIEALTQLVREVLEGVFEARMRDFS